MTKSSKDNKQAEDPQKEKQLQVKPIHNESTFFKSIDNN